MRYYANAESELPKLKAAIKKVPGTEEVEVLNTTRRIRVSWTGGCKDLPKLEAAAAGAGTRALVINHVHLALSLKALQGAQLGTLNAKLSELPGVKGGQALATGGELHADIELFDYASLTAAAEAARFEVSIRGHQWIETQTKSGDALSGERALENLFGVLVLKSGGDSYSFWALKSLNDASITKAAESVGVLLGGITRR